MNENVEGQAAQPGWYPAEDGSQRYWDGSQWTEHTSPAAGGMQAAGPGGMPVATTATGSSDEKTMGMLAHLLAIVFPVLGPLIIWLMKKDESVFVDYHGKESLNFQITLFFAWIVGTILGIVTLGLGLIIIIPVLLLVGLILPLLAGLAANKGEYYKYPLTLRLIK